MKKTLFSILLEVIFFASLLTTQSLSANNLIISHIAKHSSMNLLSQPGPVDELISLLEEYGSLMANTEDKDAYEVLQTELSEKINTLDKKYPNFEPNSNELAVIESAFNHYIEITESTNYNYEPDTEDEYDEDFKAQLALIYDNFSNIDNNCDRFIAITNYFKTKVEESDNLIDLITITNQIDGIISIYFDDFEPNESEQSKMEGPLNELGTVFESTMNKILEQDNE